MNKKETRRRIPGMKKTHIGGTVETHILILAERIEKKRRLKRSWLLQELYEAEAIRLNISVISAKRAAKAARQ